MNTQIKSIVATITNIGQTVTAHTSNKHNFVNMVLGSAGAGSRYYYRTGTARPSNSWQLLSA